VLLSIIVPVRNEIEYISRTFNSICEATVDIECEIFFADGCSSDGTYAWLEKKIKNKKNYYLIQNERKTVSFGFNLVFPKTNGQYVARLDGHTNYPNDYFKNALNLLVTDQSDIVGGPTYHIGKSWKGKTIAKCMMHPFGVGGSNFRTSSKKMFTDTVPFAVYKRVIFDKVGLYDEELNKNQDDEHNYRCRLHGFRILLDPILETEYFVRDTLSDLWSQFFYYGMFKPLVFKKVQSGKRIHHKVPALFVFFLPVFFLLGFKEPIFWIPILVYLSILVVISFIYQQTLRMKLFSILVFPCLHIAYGLGYLVGSCRFFMRKTKNFTFIL